MIFKNIEEAKHILAEAEAYIKNNTINEENVYPGAIFIFAEDKNTNFDEIYVKMVVIQAEYAKDKYVLGGNGGNPFALYSNVPRTKKEVINYFNTSVSKIIKHEKDLVSFYIK